MLSLDHSKWLTSNARQKLNTVQHYLLIPKKLMLWSLLEGIVLFDCGIYGIDSVTLPAKFCNLDESSVLQYAGFVNARAVQVMGRRFISLTSVNSICS